MTRRVQVLKRAEILALAGDLEHSPDCKGWGSRTAMLAYEKDGRDYVDQACTIPIESTCTCGYWATLHAARQKIRTLLPDADPS